MTAPHSPKDPYTLINFEEVNQQALTFADAIISVRDALIDILTKYESYEVAEDEIDRTIDLLTHLEENKAFFKLRVGSVTTFLPRNQPLYAFTCFVILPSLMASAVHFRIPHATKHFFSEVIDLLHIYKLFTNLIPSEQERIPFLKDQSALIENPATSQNRPVTDVVIFTGTSAHADHLRLIFDRRTLFITNGAGHNPIVVSDDAKLDEALQAVLALTLYNQGQDCAAPNSILVHRTIYDEFLKRLRKDLKNIKVGPYSDHSCRVGPISIPEDLNRIQSFMVENREWLDESTKGIINSAEAVIEPTIICKPLAAGGNYGEFFAPILFIQKYTNDEDLALYFEDKQYAPNAMYVTLYGESSYIHQLINKSINGSILHKKDTFIHNTHLHAKGIERGTQPYGGYGKGASNISINGEIIAFPTLPQRDIFERVAKPLLEENLYESTNATLADFTDVQRKNIEKLLKIRLSKTGKHESSVNLIDNISYLDLGLIDIKNLRYFKIEEKYIYRLYTEPNLEYISTLEIDEMKWIRSLKALLEIKSNITSDDFKNRLYDIPKDGELNNDSNKARQIRFFQHIYHLLFRRGDGPRLCPFLWELKENSVNNLLDI